MQVLCLLIRYLLQFYRSTGRRISRKIPLSPPRRSQQHKCPNASLPVSSPSLERRKEGASMRENGCGGGGGGGNFSGFNKKRAEGRDESDPPRKNLHLKDRKLNPTNSISSVQTIGHNCWTMIRTQL